MAEKIEGDQRSSSTTPAATNRPERRAGAFVRVERASGAGRARIAPGSTVRITRVASSGIGRRFGCWQPPVGDFAALRLLGQFGEARRGLSINRAADSTSSASRNLLPAMAARAFPTSAAPDAAFQQALFDTPPFLDFTKRLTQFLSVSATTGWAEDRGLEELKCRLMLPEGEAVTRVADTGSNDRRPSLGGERLFSRRLQCDGTSMIGVERQRLGDLLQRQ